MDHVPKEVRSRIMAAVHSRGNTTTELPLAKLLWAAGLRGYRKHWPVLGKPDFAWPGRKVAVFVDGCFWHGCRCKYLPRTNTEFWRNKIATNGAGTGEYRKRYGVKEGLSHELRNAPCINRQPSGGSQRRF